VGSHDVREDVVRSMLMSGELVLPMPGCGRTARRWASLADWGRSDLAVARLAEGHTDAVAILVEAGLSPEPDMLYGVWAARPGGLGASLSAGESTGSAPHGVLLGSARFCSGARILYRALVVAQPSTTAPVLAEVRLDRDGARPDPASWQADGMAGSDTLDVEFTDLPVQRTVGGPGWYTARRGFVAGGGGVAAVWWGGASGVLRRAFEHLRGNDPDQHQLAHLGELHASLAASHALLRDTADEIDAAPSADHSIAVAAVRTAVERSCRETVDRVPRVLGPGIWSGDGQLAAQLADLQMYVRQHHGERDCARLASALLRKWA
jgi:alkylation response protein AidB-like acyl-CoA dehydrogenase